MGDIPTRKPTYEEIEARVKVLEAENAALRAQIGKLLRRVEELERAGKRQAAPFSKGPPKANPNPPGRKPGASYGRWFCRPQPEQIDETIDVPVLEACPSCGGAVGEIAVEEQYQVEIPEVRPIHRCFRLHVGCCQECGAVVQPRHPLQTSDALGAAAVQLGPNALALGALLNKGFGLSWGKVADFIGRAFGLKAARSTYCRGAERLARRAEPTYHAMVRTVGSSEVLNADETGWKVDGVLHWLWVFVARLVTVYRIAASRGADVIEETVGNFRGILCRDGWAPYASLEDAIHQSCLAHHLARAREILEVAVRGAARFPHAIMNVLKAALDLRDRRENMSERGFAVARGHIEARMDRLLAWQPTYAPNGKFARHLRNERPHLFTFLYHPEVEATNWPAEQAIRPAVITRKLSGGNRSDLGAHTQEILTSIIRTCCQQGRDAWNLLAGALCSSRPVDLGLVPVPAG